MMRHWFGVEPATIADPADHSGAEFIVAAKMAAFIERVAAMGSEQTERGGFGHGFYSKPSWYGCR